MDANNRDRWFLDPGPLSTWIDHFAVDLATQRYTPLTIDGYTTSARHFAAWLGAEAISINAIDDEVVSRFAEHRCRCPGGRQWQSISPNYWRRAKRFCAFLQRAGIDREIPVIPRESAIAGVGVKEDVNISARNGGVGLVGHRDLNHIGADRQFSGEVRCHWSGIARPDLERGIAKERVGIEVITNRLPIPKAEV